MGSGDNTVMRFAPPSVSFTTELRWALCRAFGPVDRPLDTPADDGAVLRWARRLELQPRLASRLTLQRLAAETGRTTALMLFKDQAVLADRAARLHTLATELPLWGAREGLHLALLKSSALGALGVVVAGSRACGDVDVLVPGDELRAWTSLLERRGLRQVRTGDDHHHLAPFVDRAGGVVEVHKHVPGVRVAGHPGYATFGALESAGWLEPAPGLGCLLPSRELATAHCVVHGIAHHGRSPQAYPLSRMLADSIDLGLGDSTLEHAYGLIADEVPLGEWAALATLCHDLAAGDDRVFEPECANTPEGVLLRHVVAGAFHRHYRRALRAAAAFGALTAGPGPLRPLRAALRALKLTNPQIDALYGRPGGRLGYLARRLQRPFDLALRLAGAWWSRIVLRLIDTPRHATPHHATPGERPPDLVAPGREPLQ